MTSQPLVTLTVTTGPGTATVTGNTLTKDGDGNVVLAAANSYAGQTIVKTGALIVDNPLALSGINTVVTVGAALDLESNLVVEPITLNGNGIAFDGHYTGALRSISNNNVYTGTLTLNTNSTIGVDSGSSLTIASVNPFGIVNGSPALPAAQPPYSLTKELTGTLILASPDTYGGSGSTFSDPFDTGVFAMGTLVAQGALVVNDNALGAAGNTTTVLDGAQLQLESIQQVITVPSTSDALFNLTFNGATTATPLDATSTTLDSDIVYAPMPCQPLAASVVPSLSLRIRPLPCLR